MAAIANSMEIKLSEIFGLSDQDLRDEFESFEFTAYLQGSNYSQIREEFQILFSGILAGYLFAEPGRRITVYKNDLRNLINEFHPEAFNAGWIDGGGDINEIPADAKSWLKARTAAEIGYIDVLLEAAKTLKREGEPEEFGSWIDDRASGYTSTLDGIYNEGKIRAGKDINLTFVGDDGQESCRTCQKWKEKRHRKSFWIKRGLIPGQPGNPNFECRGYNCRHYLIDDQGNRFTL